MTARDVEEETARVDFARSPKSLTMTRQQRTGRSLKDCTMRVPVFSFVTRFFFKNKWHRDDNDRNPAIVLLNMSHFVSLFVPHG